jgi:hypothetical protein
VPGKSEHREDIMGNRRHFAVIVVIALTVAGTGWRAAMTAAPSVPPPVAPGSLMETGLYAAPGVVDPRNRPFSPQYPLWTDGAAKRRWIHIPDGRPIDATDAQEWQFPTGTKVWKEFAFGGRAVETRLLWKATDTIWVFASYVWNESGTDARLAPADGVSRVAEVAPNRFHSIPSVDQCRACHVTNRTEVLGFNALQLSTDRDPNALHGEPLEPGMTTLRTLAEQNLLSPARPELVSDPPRIPARTPEERALLGYLAGNCGVCHNRQGDLAPLGLHWKHSDMTTRGADALVGLTGHRSKWQVPGVPDGESLVVDPVHPEQSALLRRMRSRSPASQMPPIGTVVQDRDAVALLTGWLERQHASSSGEQRR